MRSRKTKKGEAEHSAASPFLVSSLVKVAVFILVHHR
jgi:hypothetical protein